MEKTQKILDSLQQKYRMSTTELFFKTSINFYELKDLLEDLFIQSKIEKITDGKRTYWRRKDDAIEKNN